MRVPTDSLELVKFGLENIQKNVVGGRCGSVTEHAY